MKKMLLGCVAAAAFLAAPSAMAQDIPRLSDFLAGCYRDSGSCKVKLKDYVTAAKTQKIICLKDTSPGEASSELLRWLRSDAAEPLKGQPFDDALYEGATKLYPCADAVMPPPPSEPPANPPQ